MNLNDAKKLFPHAEVINTKQDGGEYIIVRPDGKVVYALTVHVFMNVSPDGDAKKSGTETCLDVFTPETKGVEIGHFAKRGRLSITKLKYVEKEDRGMHMVSIIRRPGGMK